MILYLHGAPAFGAVERYVVQLVHGLAGREEALLAYPDVPELAPFRELAGPAVRLLPLDPALVAGPAPALAAALRRIVSRERPQVVHVTDTWAPAVVAARLAGARRILLTHHTPELPRQDSLPGRVWWALSWLARPEVIYTSETDRRGDGRRLLRTHVVELGIDLERFAGAGRTVVVAAAAPATTGTGGSGPVIGTVARLARQKGLDVLVAAAPSVLARHPEARFVVAGDGEERAALEAQAQAAGVAGSIAFLGVRDDVPELLAGFDAFALPTRFEGLCLAVIEAQAAGLPVVATPVGGIRETVLHEETGLLVPVDDAEALAAALVRLLDDPALAARLAAEGRRRALERFGVERMVERTLAVYSTKPGS